MRAISAILTCVCLCAASAASADSRVFIISNQADDGYGVDQCLAKGEKCGAHAAIPIVNRGISSRLRPIDGSIRMK
jgi:hypothetical protein